MVRSMGPGNPVWGISCVCGVMVISAVIRVTRVRPLGTGYAVFKVRPSDMGHGVFREMPAGHRSTVFSVRPVMGRTMRIRPDVITVFHECVHPAVKTFFQIHGQFGCARETGVSGILVHLQLWGS